LMFAIPNEIKIFFMLAETLNIHLARMLSKSVSKRSINKRMCGY